MILLLVPEVLSENLPDPPVTRAAQGVNARLNELHTHEAPELSLEEPAYVCEPPTRCADVR